MLSPSQQASHLAFPNIPPMDLELSPMDSILRFMAPTLQYVPKGARDAWGDLLHAIFVSIITNPSDNDSWCKCFKVSRCILFCLAKRGRCSWCDTLNAVRSRIRRWQEGDCMGPCAEVLRRRSDSYARENKSPPRIH